MKLLIDPADGPPFERWFDRNSMVIGRASSSDLLIPDPFLSRHHARLFRRDDFIFIEDLGSRNGTEVNGALITGAHRIKEGDHIRVSGSRIDLGFVAARLSTVDLQATVLRPAKDLLRRTKLDTQDGDVDSSSLRDYAERLRALNEIYKEIGATLSLRELHQILLQRVLALLDAQHVALFLLDRHGEFFKAATLSHPKASDSPPPYSRQLVHEVCVKGMSALINDAANDQRFSTSQSLILSGLNSLAAAPLLNQHGSLGMIVATTTAALHEFDEEDLELLTSVSSVAALKIRNLRLAQAAIERQRDEQELAIARRIQESLLPQTLPTFEGVELFARNTPSRGVSGDFFQICSQLDGDRCLILIVDVSGKGVPAALLTASIEALAAGPIEENQNPDEILKGVSRRLYDRSPPEKYATAFLAILEPQTGQLRYANAGHNPPLLVSADGSCRQLEVAGKPLGLIRGSEYASDTAQLAPGDALVAYTDGLTEALNPTGDEYGIDRLTASAVWHRTLPIDDYGSALLKDIDAFVVGEPPVDDATVVIARRRANPQDTLPVQP